MGRYLCSVRKEDQLKINLIISYDSVDVCVKINCRD